MAQYPALRLRRNRQAKWLRNLLAETRLNVNDFIWPVFIREGEGVKEPLPTMPGVYRYSIDQLLTELQKAVSLGINAIALFPMLEHHLKDDRGTESTNPNNLVCRAIKVIKQNFPNLGVICDVALDPYTSHGQDGVVVGDVIDNDVTVPILCQQALVQAEAGCDIVAPSDMMDGRIGRIREALDNAGYVNTGIIAYAAKFSSNYYGPFRDGVGTRSCLGQADKNTYQLAYSNPKEAMREAKLDIDEGADIIMVKPALLYLDIISRIYNETTVPIFAYHVSGEYAMVKFAAKHGCLDEKSAMYEALLSIKRAGAQAIFTYAALEMAEYLSAL